MCSCRFYTMMPQERHDNNAFLAEGVGSYTAEA